MPGFFATLARFRGRPGSVVHGPVVRSIARDRGVAQPGRVLRSGRRSRRFKSSHPDQSLRRPFQHRVRSGTSAWKSLPLWVQLTALGALLLISALFSISETAMMALSRLRLRHLVRQGNRSGQARPGPAVEDRPAARHHPARQQPRQRSRHGARHGHGDPAGRRQRVGAARRHRRHHLPDPRLLRDHAQGDRRDVPRTHRLAALVSAGRRSCACSARWSGSSTCSCRPCCGCCAFPRAPSGESTRLTTEELRTLVLEGGNFIPGKHRSILLNLFDLEALSVDDVMTPRARIEALDIEQPADAGARTTPHLLSQQDPGARGRHQPDARRAARPQADAPAGGRGLH